MGRAEVLQAHLYVLNNTEEVIPYLTDHKKIVKAKNHRMNHYQLLNEHNNTFIDWFKLQIKNDPSASETLRWLAHDPCFNVVCWSGYDINNYTFYTKSKDEVSTTQNSGVMVMASSMHFSSAKDANPIFASIPYFGVIDEIWELSYRTFKVPLFKCKWVNTSKNSVHTDEMGFTLLDLEKVSYNEEPFIMADQAKQVFYVKDPSSRKWSVVLQVKKGSDEDSSLAISETPCFLTNVPTLVDDNEVDGDHAARKDHDEGILCE